VLRSFLDRASFFSGLFFRASTTYEPFGCGGGQHGDETGAVNMRLIAMMRPPSVVTEGSP